VVGCRGRHRRGVKAFRELDIAGQTQCLLDRASNPVLWGSQEEVQEASPDIDRRDAFRPWAQPERQPIDGGAAERLSGRRGFGGGS